MLSLPDPRERAQPPAAAPDWPRGLEVPYTEIFYQVWRQRGLDDAEIGARWAAEFPDQPPLQPRASSTP